MAHVFVTTMSCDEASTLDGGDLIDVGGLTGNRDGINETTTHTHRHKLSLSLSLFLSCQNLIFQSRKCIIQFCF